MRGVSAFLVFFVHFWALFGVLSPQTRVNEIFRFLGTLGHCGVDVFFALSGFIIYGMLLKKRVQYLEFVRNRLIRLYPVFLSVFLLYLVLSFAIPSYSKIPGSFLPAASYLVANILLLPGIFPIVPMITVAWSLSYELCFYLTVPLLFQWFNLSRWPKLARIAFFASLVVGWLTLWSAGFVGHPRLIMFGCGILLREIIHYRIGWEALGGCFAVALFAAALTLAGFRGQPAITQSCGPIITSSAFGWLILFLSTLVLGYFGLGGNGWLSRWLSWDWLRWFGNISYSYYLVHGLVLHAVKTVADVVGLSARLSTISFVAFGAVCFAATVLGSSVMFLAVEKPFLSRRAMGSRLSGNADNRTAVPSLGSAP